MGEEELNQLIAGCVKQDRKSQKMLYKAFYGYTMGICLRYAGNRYEAAEIMNTGFFKALTNISRFDQDKPFKAWLGRIMMNASVDYYRANLKTAYTEELDKAEHIGHEDTINSKLDYEELLALIQKLPHSYRTVFNLYAIDGYQHDEIAEMLGINIGTSKSSLHKARQKLKEMLTQTNSIVNNNNIKHAPMVAIKHMAITEIFLNKGISR